MMTRTATSMASPITISPKAVLALLFPAVGTVVMLVLHSVLDPKLDPTLVAAIVGIVDPLLALAGAYVGAPGQVIVKE